MSELDLKEMEQKLRDGWIKGKPYVFVSYASANKDKVFEAVLELRKKGINVYIDVELQENISKNWLENVKERLLEYDCKGMVSFLSIDYMRSYACLIEQLMTTSEEMSDTKGKKLPNFYISLDENMSTPQKMAKVIYGKAAKQSEDMPVAIVPEEKTVLQEVIENNAEIRNKLKESSKTVSGELDIIKNKHHVVVKMYKYCFSDKSVSIQLYKSAKECADLLYNNFVNEKNDSIQIDVLQELVERYGNTQEISENRSVYQTNKQALKDTSELVQESIEVCDTSNESAHTTEVPTDSNEIDWDTFKGALRYHVTENDADGYIEQRGADTWVICAGSKFAPKRTESFDKVYGSQMEAIKVFQNGVCTSDYECGLEVAYRYLVMDVVSAKKKIQMIQPEIIESCEPQKDSVSNTKECLSTVSAKQKMHEVNFKSRVSFERKLKKKQLVEIYQGIKTKLGKVPSLLEVYRENECFPEQIFEYAKTYQNFLQVMEQDYNNDFNDEQNANIAFITAILANGKRVHELIILKMILEGQEVSWETFEKRLQEFEPYRKLADYESAVRVLKKAFIVGCDITSYEKASLVEGDASKLIASATFSKYLKDDLYRSVISDLIDYSMQVYVDRYSTHDENLLTHYMTYTRKDVCRILNWEKDETATLFGYRIKYNTCPMFVTIEKKDVTKSLDYTDMFIDEDSFMWMTRNGVTLDHDEAVAIRNHKESGLKLFLFVKQNKEDKEFFYVGTVTPETMEQTSIATDKGKNKPIVRIEYILDRSLDPDFYSYIC